MEHRNRDRYDLTQAQELQPFSRVVPRLDVRHEGQDDDADLRLPEQLRQAGRKAHFHFTEHADHRLQPLSHRCLQDGLHAATAHCQCRDGPALYTHRQQFRREYL